eukprot:3913581-Lingulodinium_polyedra.AAC.1
MEHEDVHLDGRGDMPPDSITLTCNDVPVPIVYVDVDNESMTEKMSSDTTWNCVLQTKCR